MDTSSTKLAMECKEDIIGKSRELAAAALTDLQSSKLNAGFMKAAKTLASDMQTHLQAEKMNHFFVILCERLLNFTHTVHSSPTSYANAFFPNSSATIVDGTIRSSLLDVLIDVFTRKFSEELLAYVLHGISDKNNTAFVTLEEWFAVTHQSTISIKFKQNMDYIGDAELCGCLFHLGQSFFRQVQAAGLNVVYREEGSEEMRSDFHALIAIAFVPEDDVEDAFDSLQEVSDPALRPVFQHVEDNYVRGRLQARRRGGRVQARGRPMFPPALWNCYSRAAQGLPRTTNTCEAWHRRLGTLVGKNHPTMPATPPPKRRTQYEVTDARVARIQARYEEYRAADDVLGYLRAIGANVAGNYLESVTLLNRMTNAMNLITETSVDSSIMREKPLAPTSSTSSVNMAGAMTFDIRFEHFVRCS
ncbi:5-keto-4-deoxy-D-glucarate aldolase [Frankliniella fusca]|uniref:5-keto-4-deoxy-D-glucarate aldolase n=1 Tax=Frankliniella fusca TaxID=407009 RepID=A0AAE1LN22_9NEOP|nr:5-keto-4-deoxy-D-glucarate aldolase [Frankliniella fusca]